VSPAETLRRALDLLELEVPGYHAAVVKALDGLVVQCRVDHVDFTVTAGGTLTIHEERPDLADVLAVSSHRAILALIDGRTTMLEAVLGRGVMVRAEIGLMVRLSQAQRAFAEGAARTRQMRDVLETYRREGVASD
jgi:hypothetical protein